MVFLICLLDLITEPFLLTLHQFPDSEFLGSSLQLTLTSEFAFVIVLVIFFTSKFFLALFQICEIFLPQLSETTTYLMRPLGCSPEKDP